MTSEKPDAPPPAGSATGKSPGKSSGGPSGGRGPYDQAAADAQAELDRLRHEAGGALSGRELQYRQGLSEDDVVPDPPLDWRLTPRNVALQLLGVAVFVLVVWFLVDLMVDSWGALLAPRVEDGQ